ncbi:MAG TPA: DUF6799 domain-containing protein [Verrucomicrobiae bacterium]|nr:DUF6799 domain-containing protein [Verrucomicrobiae bacterium]
MSAIHKFAFSWLFLAFAVSVFGQGGVESVLNKDGKVLAQVSGNLVPMKAAVAFPAGIVVNTNGLFKVGQGPERKLENGQAITADGMLHKPDGSVGPVFDHYVIRGNRVYIVKDGAAPALVTQQVAFPDGSSLLPDGSYRSGGRVTRLIDGQTLAIGGNVIPSVDSVSLRSGKVVVQKDGALIPVASSITMNDGTKVMANGTMISFDGRTTRQLKEGETVTLPGAVLKR